MAKKKSNIRKVARKAAKQSPSFFDYVKRIGLLVASGMAGAALHAYADKKTYERLRASPALDLHDEELDYQISSPVATGRGDYSLGLRRMAKAGMTAAGGVAGGVAGALTAPYTGLYGARVGSALGGSLGQTVGDYVFGAGDYTVKSNTLATHSMALQPGMPAPVFAGVGTHCTRVVHREFVRDVVVPSTPAQFTNITQAINLGNTALFPWLSSVAAQFQQYEINGMIVEYRPLTSEYTSSGALGSIIIATNYDVLEAPYADKVHMENAQYSVSCKPSQGLLHTVECEPSERPTKLLYVRDNSSSGTTSQDAGCMDLGNLQVATVGLPFTAGTVLGELWITYDISLYKPEVVNTLAFYELVQPSGSTIGSPFGTSQVVSGATFFSVNNGNLITFNSTGQFVMELYCGAGTNTVSAITFTPPTGSTVTALETSGVGLAGAGTATFMFLFTPNSPGAQYAVGAGGTALNVTIVRTFRIA